MTKADGIVKKYYIFMLLAFSHVLVKLLGSRWWTSATDAGCPGKMAWCGSGVTFSKEDLGSLDAGGVKDKGSDQCVVLKRPAALGAASCVENNRPLCEVNNLEAREIFV
jgi:hypothetical protein